MRLRRSRFDGGTDQPEGRVRRYRGLVALIGVLTAILVGVGGAALCLSGKTVEARLSGADAPAESEFFGTWCSSRGDRFDLADGRFSIDPMSPTLAGQIGYFVPTPDPSRVAHWDDPPATSAAGSWYLDVMGPDLLSGQVVSIQAITNQLDGEAVVGDDLIFSIDRTDTGWQLHLPLKPTDASELTFVRCANAK